MQLNIYEDPERPLDVIESYTFTFNYAQSAEHGRTLTSMELRGPGGQTMTVGHAKRSMCQMIRMLCTSIQNLPSLPGM